MNAKVINTVDTNYKNGKVTCNCGWTQEFGDGFNQYEIESCPNCDSQITTRIQNTVTTGRSGNYKIQTGLFYYFAMDNGIHTQYKEPYIQNTSYRERLKQ
jgi:hypothetical protein